MVIIKIKNNAEIGSFSWLVFGRILQMIISFFIGVISARFLGPSNYGLLNYAGAYCAFFTSLCTLGINSIIVKSLIDEPQKQGEILGTTLVLRFLSSILSAIAILCIVFVIDYGNLLVISVVALSCFAMLFQIFDTFNYWFQSRYQSKVIAISLLAAYIFTSTYKVILLMMQKDVRWFAFASSIDYLLIAIFLFIGYLKNKGPRLSFSIKRSKILLGNSYHFILSGMMVAIYGQTDKIMLKQMLDETAVGYYSLAVSLNSIWCFVLTAIIDSLYPNIMKLNKTDKFAYERKNKQLYALVIYISFFVAIMFAVFGKFAVNLLYGEAFLGAVAPLKIVALYTAFSYLGVARDAWIICENNQKYLKYIYFFAAILNVLLNYLLIPKFGASGAALASLATQLLTSMIIPLFIKDMRHNVRLMGEAILLKGVFK